MQRWRERLRVEGKLSYGSLIVGSCNLSVASHHLLIVGVEEALCIVVRAHRRSFPAEAKVALLLPFSLEVEARMLQAVCESKRILAVPDLVPLHLLQVP